MEKEHWSPKQKEHLLKMWGKTDIEEISEKIGKTPTAIKLYLHRNRLAAVNLVKRNIVVEILTLKFVHPECFRPTRQFYSTVKISQKKWWDLYYGRKQISENEYKSLVDYFSISIKDAFEARQLTLFTDDSATNNR